MEKDQNNQEKKKQEKERVDVRIGKGSCCICD